MKDVFMHFLARPMLLGESKPFNSPDYIYELKLDGIRALAYLDKTTEIRNKRNKSVTSIYPEINNIHKQIRYKCILDGELIVTQNGKPDFFEIQRRSLMTDEFKIKLASERKPVVFVVYDIIYYKNKEIIALPLMERKEILQKNVIENNSLIITRFIEEKGIEFFEQVAKQNLEGIVAKKKTSLYYYGKRTKEWLKIKKMYDEEFLICGYIPRDNNFGIKSIILGKYHNNEVVYQGQVSLGIPKVEEELIIKYVEENPSSCPFLQNFKEKNVLWCRLGLICTVKYMMKTEKNLLRQPIYKGLRFY